MIPRFPTAYFPSILYVRELVKWQKAAIDVSEHWIKQTTRNRCEILTSSGIQKLIVPIQHSESKQTISAIQADLQQNWKTQHIRSITTAYKNAPYFEDFETEIFGFIHNHPNSLWEGNLVFLQWILNEWEIPIDIEVATDFEPYEEKDLRKMQWFEKERSMKKYQQVFGFDKPFVPNLSVLDLLFNEGPMGRNWILA